MTEHVYPVEVQPDFLEKITRAKPIHGLAELIWNSLDADATVVDVRFDYNDLGTMSAIIVTDNGTGIAHNEAPELFRRLGGSWKKSGATTNIEGRFLHGQDGRGRFKAFALGRIAEWDVTYERNRALWTFTVTMNEIQAVRISDEVEASAKARGVVLTVSELERDYRTFTSEPGIQELTEIFALYLSDYRSVAITVDGTKLDPAGAIASRHALNLADIIDDGNAYPTRLELIEWRATNNRTLYLCTDKGFPLLRVDRRFHVGSFQFSAYVESAFVGKLQREGIIELAEMNPLINAAIDEAYQAIKDYFRSRAAEDARTVVAEWKDENIYPFTGEPTTHIETVERQVFDIVAVNVAQYLPDFDTAPRRTSPFTFACCVRRSRRSQRNSSSSLKRSSSSPSASRKSWPSSCGMFPSRRLSARRRSSRTGLRFLMGLETILFDAEPKRRLKERSQLHRIVAQNCWLFGEEFNLSVDDQSLTEVLRKHRKLLGDDIAIDEPVKHISQERGIIDLMLSRAIRRHGANDLTHLIVELKAPKMKINTPEVTQIEEYAFSVAGDERFRNVNTTWDFWVISDDYGDYAAKRMLRSDGLIYQGGNISIYVKTWGQVLESNRARLQFFQEHLEYQADKGASLKHLQEHYAKFIQGVLTPDEPAGDPDFGSGA